MKFLRAGCDGAPLLPLLFVIVNMAFNISLLHLLKISSAVVSCLASTFSGIVSLLHTFLWFDVMSESILSGPWPHSSVEFLFDHMSTWPKQASARLEQARYASERIETTTMKYSRNLHIIILTWANLVFSKWYFQYKLDNFLDRLVIILMSPSGQFCFLQFQCQYTYSHCPCPTLGLHPPSHQDL